LQDQVSYFSGYLLLLLHSLWWSRIVYRIYYTVKNSAWLRIKYDTLSLIYHYNCNYNYGNKYGFYKRTQVVLSPMH